MAAISIFCDGERAATNSQSVKDLGGKKWIMDLMLMRDSKNWVFQVESEGGDANSLRLKL